MVARQPADKSGRPSVTHQGTRNFDMTAYSHQTAPTEYVETKGIRFAYRRFGKTGSVPLVFNMHFTGTMDHWDPARTAGSSQDREGILFNHAGISSTAGEGPTTIRGMAANAAACIKPLGRAHLDTRG